MRSASSTLSVFSKPSAAASTSAILSESYSFIWQPKVRMKTFLAVSAMASSWVAEVESGQAGKTRIVPEPEGRTAC